MRVVSEGIQVKWITPQVLPEHFKIKSTCVDMRNHDRFLQKLLHGDTNRQEYNVDPQKNLLLITDIETPGECEITFIACYNPASQDKGVTKILNIPSPSKYLLT